MWFTGSVNEAIVKSKAEKKLFVVFISGSDGISSKMEKLYESIADPLSSLPIVSIKLDSQSENCKLFSQIYPVIVIPSTYFIDLNGVAIEIIGGSIETKEVLLEKINKTIDMFRQNLPGSSSISSNPTPDNKIQENTEITSNSDSNVDKELPQKSTIKSNDESIAGTSDSNTNDSNEQISSVSDPQNDSQPTLDAKVERANQLLEAIRQKKAKEEEEKERANEIERRKGMKEMQKAKRLREEQEAMEIIKEREREKREEKLARERVLAQIAADREERKRRQMTFNPSTSNEKNNFSSDEDKAPELRQRVNDKTRIQFKLPDGSTHNHIFETKDKLETVAQYVSSNLNVRSFVLSTTFPRKEFLQQEYNQTLEGLSLAPSSVLLVINKSSNISSGSVVSASVFWQLFTYVSLPFVMVWNLIMSLFGRSNPSTSGRTDNNPGNSGQRPTNRGTNRNFYSKDGNIARMRDPNDDEDDNNTWNGNSTQQM